MILPDEFQIEPFRDEEIAPPHRDFRQESVEFLLHQRPFRGRPRTKAKRPAPETMAKRKARTNEGSPNDAMQSGYRRDARDADKRKRGRIKPV